MASLNQFNVIGIVGKDPESKILSNNAKVTNFSVAVSKNYTDKASGELVQNTLWVKVNTWNKLAEIVESYVRKGSQVYITGEANIETWIGKDEKAAGNITLTASSVVLLGKKGDNPSSNDGGDDTPRKPPVLEQDDIPF